MARLFEGDGTGQASDGGSMAPPGIPLVLALPFETRAASGRSLDSGFDSRNEWRQPAVGSTRIHGELLKLGMKVLSSTAARLRNLRATAAITDHSSLSIPATLRRNLKTQDFPKGEMGSFGKKKRNDSVRPLIKRSSSVLSLKFDDKQSLAIFHISAETYAANL